jgi:cob(I)alamin adenosyltransferase
VDEAQATLGLARASGCTPRTREILLAIQRDLYSLMAELAAAGQDDSPFSGNITQAHVDALEGWIAECEEQVETPKEFVIPGDSKVDAALHLARTVVRRAERLSTRLVHQGLLANEWAVQYLNRLSSLLFVLAYFEGQAATGGRPTQAKEA